jgi:hypothetical protein
MSALHQIETVVVELPAQDQRSLLAWLQARLEAKQESAGSAPESLKLFRQLQEEVGLTPEAVKEWKTSVANGRR